MIISRLVCCFTLLVSCAFIIGAQDLDHQLTVLPGEAQIRSISGAVDTLPNGEYVYLTQRNPGLGTDYDLEVFRISSFGALLDTRLISAPEHQFGRDAKVSPDGDIWLFGYTMSPQAENPSDLFLIRLDENLDVISEFSVDLAEVEYATELFLLPENRLAIRSTGSAVSGTNRNAYLSVIDGDSGAIIWSKQGDEFSGAGYCLSYNGDDQLVALRSAYIIGISSLTALNAETGETQWFIDTISTSCPDALTQGVSGGIRYLPAESAYFMMNNCYELVKVETNGLVSSSPPTSQPDFNTFSRPWMDQLPNGDVVAWADDERNWFARQADGSFLPVDRLEYPNASSEVDLCTPLKNGRRLCVTGRNSVVFIGGTNGPLAGEIQQLDLASTEIIKSSFWVGSGGMSSGSEGKQLQLISDKVVVSSIYRDNRSDVHFLDLAGQIENSLEFDEIIDGVGKSSDGSDQYQALGLKYFFANGDEEIYHLKFNEEELLSEELLFTTRLSTPDDFFSTTANNGDLICLTTEFTVNFVRVSMYRRFSPQGTLLQEIDVTTHVLPGRGIELANLGADKILVVSSDSTYTGYSMLVLDGAGEIELATQEAIMTNSVFDILGLTIHHDESRAVVPNYFIEPGETIDFSLLEIDLNSGEILRNIVVPVGDRRSLTGFYGGYNTHPNANGDYFASYTKYGEDGDEVIVILDEEGNEQYRQTNYTNLYTPNISYAGTTDAGNHRVYTTGRYFEYDSLYQYTAYLSWTQLDNVSDVGEPTENPLGLSVSIFPNPTFGELAIEWEQPGHSYKIDLFNQDGRRIRNWRGDTSPGGKILRTDVSQLPSGTYFLRVKSGGMTKTTTFFKH